ncbi:POK25 protein, partial [Cepphus grylle]|nr:POK25 protein [Cepphus grylle]
PAVVLDIKDCFFSIPLAPRDRPRFAFTIPAQNHQEPDLRYQWTVLPQGMKNSPVICQTVVAKVLEPIRQRFPDSVILHYMDDILLAAVEEQRVIMLEAAVI